MWLGGGRGFQIASLPVRFGAGWGEAVEGRCLVQTRLRAPSELPVFADNPFSRNGRWIHETDVPPFFSGPVSEPPGSQAQGGPTRPGISDDPGRGTPLLADPLRGPLTASAASGRPTPDFRSLDFDRLWIGRDRVTEVERSVVREALATVSPSRVLEIGTGAGRLSSVIQGNAREYAALDITPEFLARIPLRNGTASLRVAANVYHLPFVDQAFPAVVMVRVLGFLEDPRAALEEIGRVMRPGGLLVVSYNPHPSVASLVDDLKVGLSRSPTEPKRSMTFSRQAIVPVRPSSFPAWSLTRAEFRRTVDAAGLVGTVERPTGWEEYPGLRKLPAKFFHSLSHAASRIGGFPTRFALLRRPGESLGPPAEWGQVLACPACRSPLGASTRHDLPAITCTQCHRSWPREDGILDARWPAPPEIESVVTHP